MSTSTFTYTPVSASLASPASAADVTSASSRGPAPIAGDPWPLAADGLLDPALLLAAQARIGAAFLATPLVRSDARGAWLKLENLQVTGAYKVRGAFNALAAQVARGDRRPVVAASAGNYGQGVAWSARHFDLPATIVVPASAPSSKVGGCRALGAQVVWGGETFESCVSLARRLARDGDRRFLHAFDDPEVIAGQAAVAGELLSARPDVVVVPIGGGGLVAGMGSVLRRAGIRVVGAQVAGVDAFRRALSGDPPGGAVSLSRVTLADGLRVGAPGQLTLRIGAAFLDQVVVVEEEEVAAAVVALALQDKVIAEGAGAVAVAALAHVTGDKRVAVVSGGNIDARVLSRLLGEGP